MSLDMNDAYQAHAFFALEFDREECGRLVDFSSSFPKFTDKWYSELAIASKKQGWFVPPSGAKDKMDVLSAWCPDRALKLNLTKRV